MTPYHEEMLWPLLEPSERQALEAFKVRHDDHAVTICFSNGGGIGPYTVYVRCDHCRRKKNITDTSGW